MLTLVFLAVAAWTLQALLALLQYRRFQVRFNRLSGKYNIGVGQWKNRFGIGAIVIICADEQGIIEKVEFMQGITVFARFRTLKEYIGRSVFNDFQTEEQGNAVTNAFNNALANIKKIMGGEKKLQDSSCV